MYDARRLLFLGCCCRRATAAFALLCRRMDAEVRRGERIDMGEMAETASLAGRLEESAEVLQELSRDAALLALLPHRARFGDLVRMAEAMDRGVMFVPATVVTVGSVVVVPKHDPAARRASLRQRFGQGLARVKQRAA